MNSKTVAELREIAKKLGITGYSKLRKDELLEAIAAATGASKAKAPTPKPAAKKAAAKPGAAAAKQKAARAKPETAPAIGVVDEEQRIEGSKYAIAPHGEPVRGRAYVADIDENIDDLGALAHEPRLTLLPQKPGVLHAYWRLSPGHATRQPGLCLRLGLVHDRDFYVQAEVPVRSDSGSWYFRVDDSWHPEAVYLQIGYYGPDGKFVLAIDRGIVRLPRLFARTRYGVNWALTQEEFEGIRGEAGPLGTQVPAGWPQGPSSYELVSSHLMSSRGTRDKNRN
jgi:hypothetical protein